MNDAEALRAYRIDELYELMSDISEDCYCAGWMMGNEFRLWHAITDANDDKRYGQSEIAPQQIQRLKELSQAVGGWWRWDDKEGAQFVSLEKWAEILREIEEKNADAERKLNEIRPFCWRCGTRAPGCDGCIAKDCGIRVRPTSTGASQKC